MGNGRALERYAVRTLWRGWCDIRKYRRSYIPLGSFFHLGDDMVAGDIGRWLYDLLCALGVPVMSGNKLVWKGTR